MFSLFSLKRRGELEEVEDAFKGVKLAWNMGVDKRQDEERTPSHKSHQAEHDEVVHVEDTSGSM
jgi:hypothetical protein